jgi:opacity protein-like surface antigen
MDEIMVRLSALSLCTLFTLLAAGPVFAQEATSSSQTNERTRDQSARTQPAGNQSSASEPASPSGASMRPRVFVFGNFGFGGEFETEFDIGQASEDFEMGDMKMTTGFGAHIGFTVHRNFTLGGRLSYLTYTTDDMEDADYDRGNVVNLDAAPKARYPLQASSAELYATIPIGITVSPVPDEVEDVRSAQVRRVNPRSSTEYNTGVTWNVSILGGASYKFGQRFGAFVEGGWYNQNIKWKVEVSDEEGDETGSFSQFGLMAGLMASF